MPLSLVYVWSGCYWLLVPQGQGEPPRISKLSCSGRN